MTEDAPIIPYLTVVPFPTRESDNTPVDEILALASEVQLKSVLVLGIEQNDQLYISGSDNSLAEILWLLKICEKEILEMSLGE